MTAPAPHFHPAVAQWFARTFDAPTEAQRRGWASIAAGRDTLIAAPTGSGKTLAAFLWAIDGLVRDGLTAELPPETRILYVSPLKALASDVEHNLQAPLDGVRAVLAAQGTDPPQIRTAVRTGDTPSAARARAVRRPPHIFVTTPESLYILLTSCSGRRLLATVRTVIVDEIHAVVGDKRGAHLALSLERLDALVGSHGGAPPVRIGLSATQRPIEAIAAFLCGVNRSCAVVDTGHLRDLDLAIETTSAPLETVMPNEVWEEVYDRLAALAAAHTTTLIFVNTRRLAERVARHLGERLGVEHVAAHHGSLARGHRLDAERRLKTGEVCAVVATASLELGIDIGTVDLVCQLGSPRSIATLVQRVGRSGHAVRGTPKGRLFPLSRDDLVECTALLSAVQRGELDALSIPNAPLDIAAQQIVAACAAEPWYEDDLFALLRRAHAYRDLPRADYDAIIGVLSEGFATRRGRRGAHLHRDGVHHRIRGRAGARMTAITSGGAIPDLADYDVVLQPEGTLVGSLNEDFAIESMSGDIFQLGNTSWRILKVERGRVLVEDARGLPPTIPFWFGEAPGRTAELSAAVAQLRERGSEPIGASNPVPELELLGREQALQLTEYLTSARDALGAMPSQRTLVLERFFDDAGGMQLILHAPFGTRINRAWGLALRKRFCQRFNFELQAAANDDAILLSLGPVHSFPLREVFDYLRPGTVRPLLTQALLDAPMFMARWRWNAGRALAVPRFAGGKRLAPQLQRIRADDLLTVAFPDQVACAENLTGAREIPDHPLVAQTIEDCLTEAMDVDGLEAILAAIDRGALTLVARDLPQPSPLAHGILNARPYAFLDDAPLEERRTHAVTSGRLRGQGDAVGALDTAAAERVRNEAWPQPRDTEEVHDALLVAGAVADSEISPPWRGGLDALVADGRAMRHIARGRELWVATERVTMVLAALGGAIDPPVPNVDAPAWTAESAMAELLRGRLSVTGPVRASELSVVLGASLASVDAGLAELEAQGFALRGPFTREHEQWCERGLLARIHRYTLRRLRAEIEPVTAATFTAFLLRWQHVDPDARVSGPEGTLAALEQLEGFEVPAAAWERQILPARVAHYEASWLDGHCLAGRLTWLRLAATGPRADGPRARTPIALVPRGRVGAWRGPCEVALRPEARAVCDLLRHRGASFMDDLADAAGLDRGRVEDALAELVAAGLVTADGFSGLRALIVPRLGLDHAGRWSALHTDGDRDSDTTVEHIARVLLRRYGVVFRRVLERERSVPPWYRLLRVYRRLEARGEIRGGRFVERFAGEQYALPRAVAELREVRRRGPQQTLVAVSCADPLNLVGIIGTGAKIPARARDQILYCDGVAVALRRGKDVSWLADVDPELEWRGHAALLGRARGAPLLDRRADP